MPRRYHKNYHRTMRKMRGFIYRGFKVELYNNHWYSFRFEWKVKPLGPVALRLTQMKGRLRRKYGRFQKVISDPTSMSTIKPTIEYAMIQVNELRHPFWWKR